MTRPKDRFIRMEEWLLKPANQTAWLIPYTSHQGLAKTVPDLADQWDQPFMVLGCGYTRRHPTYQASTTGLWVTWPHVSTGTGLPDLQVSCLGDVTRWTLGAVGYSKGPWPQASEALASWALDNHQVLQVQITSQLNRLTTIKGVLNQWSKTPEGLEFFRRPDDSLPT